MIRSVTTPPVLGGGRAALPMQPGTYELIAVSFAYTPGPTSGAIITLDWVYGGVASVAQIALTGAIATVTSPLQAASFVRDAAPLDVTLASGGRIVQQRMPRITITPQTEVSLGAFDADALDEMSGIHWLLDDEPLRRQG